MGLAGCLGAAEPASSAGLELELTLAECILLAVQNNRDLAAGRLGGLSERLSLEDAEDEFRPVPRFGVSVERRPDDATLRVGPGVVLRIPTGGTISLNAGSESTNPDAANRSTTATQFVEFRFSQPLLKGAGIAVGTAGLEEARRRERRGVLAFRGAVMQLVTAAIGAYRQVIRSMRAVEIADRSLRRARDQLVVNRALIEAGRMAAEDIVETEASVAERELSLTEAQGALDDAHLALIGILDIDSQTRIRPTETLRIEPQANGATHGVELALQNRPDYLQALLAIESADAALLVADNARRWELNLDTSARFGHNDRSLLEAYGRFDREDHWVGLSLSIPLGPDADRQLRAWQRARISLRQSRLRIEELRQAIDLEVRGAVRNVEVQLRRAELARQARELAERKLETERIKLNAGLSSNFRLVTFEDDLVRSQNSEVGATIAYLNALTTLDQVLGTTLDTWQIDISSPAGDEAQP